LKSRDKDSTQAISFLIETTKAPNNESYFSGNFIRQNWILYFVVVAADKLIPSIHLHISIDLVRFNYSRHNRHRQTTGPFRELD